LKTARDLLSNLAIFILVVLGAMAIDGLLHLLGHREWGRQLGYWGSALILLSLLHSARKRKAFTLSRTQSFLRLHEFLAWLGATMVLVHGGIHFDALLPWLALIAMLITGASGLTGKFLLKKSKALISQRRKSMLAEGMTKEASEERLYWDSLVVGMMQKWRKVHVPITTAFALLFLLHVASVMIFWRW
jgi:hypothetical protein